MTDNSENDDDNDYDDANDDNHLVRTGDGPVQKGLFENTVADLSTTSRPVIYFKIFVFRCCRQATLASLRDAGTDSNKAEKTKTNRNRFIGHRHWLPSCPPFLRRANWRKFNKSLMATSIQQREGCRG